MAVVQHHDAVRSVICDIVVFSVNDNFVLLTVERITK